MAGTRTVAIVDDEAEVRLSTGDLLRSYGYRVILFESAEHFLSTADLAEVGVLITDFRMPGLDGGQLIDALRAKGARFPIVVMSAVNPDETRARVIEKGAAAFLPKPVDPEALTTLLTALGS